MEAADEVASNVVKGKRTKRHRVQSPIPIAFTSGAGENIDAIGEHTDDNGKFTNEIGENTDGNSKFPDAAVENTDENRKLTDGNEKNTDGNGKITDGMLGITDGTVENENEKNAETMSVGDVNECINAENSTNVSPTSSQELIQSQGTTEEEDVANCLILLAQGDPMIHSIVPISTGTKFNSRKFMETSGTGGSGKGGYYVYECKTCCRTFPSFQALGGHRASHKKPKGMINNYNYNYNYNDEKKVANSSEEDLEFSSLSLQLNNTNTSIINKSKIHECSICGAEFASGQALGGHMRRHRAPTNTNPKNLSLAPMVIEPSQPNKQKNVVSLDLDLNLPAPDVEDKQNHLNQQQKSPLVLPGPALVDCHY